jgi:hypothetical protein
MLKTPIGGQSAQSALAGVERKLAGHDPDDADIPASVRRSVRFMLGGAAVTVLAGLFSIIATVADPRLINNGKPPVSGAETGYIVQVLVLTVVYGALWVLMARMNRSGQTWARIVASILFIISTFSIYSAVSSLNGAQYLAAISIVSLILAIAQWLSGLGAIAFVWRAESSEYFRERSARRSSLGPR